MKQRTCEIVPVAEAFALKLDGHDLMTPAGKTFALPTSYLAEAVASEWRAQKEKPQPSAMPLTQLAATAIDIIALQRNQKIAELMAYATSDLLCHRVDEPLGLSQQQKAVWDPLLDWCDQRFGARLATGTGVMPVPQTATALTSLLAHLRSINAFELSGLADVVHVTGSLILGLALADRRLHAAGVFEAAELDTSFQMEKWGSDPALDNKRAEILKQLKTAEDWFCYLSA